jgi:hypothetical protein
MIRMQAISQGLLALRLAGLVATFEQVKKKKQVTARRQIKAGAHGGNGIGSSTNEGDMQRPPPRPNSDRSSLLLSESGGGRRRRGREHWWSGAQTAETCALHLHTNPLVLRRDSDGLCELLARTREAWPRQRSPPPLPLRDNTARVYSITHTCAVRSSPSGILFSISGRDRE